MSTLLPAHPDNKATHAPVSAPGYQPPPPPRTGEAHAPELDWRTYVAAIRRNKWLVWGMVALGLAGGIGLASILKPTYLAEANLWVDTPREGGKNPGPTWSSQLLGTTGWIDLLRSDVIIGHTMRAKRLYLVPRKSADAPALAGLSTGEQYRAGNYRLEVDEAGTRFTLTNRDTRTSARGAVGDSVGRSFGIVWLPPKSALAAGRRIDFELLTSREASERLLKNLVVRPGRERNFIHLELRGEDPVQTTAVVNAISDRFVSIALDLKRQKLSELTAILGEQLASAAGNVAAAEAELKAFRASTATQRVQATDPSSLGFLTTRVEQEQVRADREALVRELAGVEAGGSVRALGTIAAVQRAPDLTRALQDLTTKEAELRALRSRYTDEYPGVQQLAAEIQTLERVTVPALTRTLVDDLATQEARLQSRVASASDGLRDMSPLPVEEGRLTRNLRVAEELFVDIRKRYEEARLADVSISPDIRVLDAAHVPDEPLYNRGPLVIVLAFLGSLGLGIAGAVVRDLLDPKVRYPAQISRELGLPLLGVVPHVPRGNPRDMENIAPVIEALRGVRLNVLHAHGAAGPLLLTITSPGMGEGKSFVTSNLALAFADAGYRTLLIDGDIRRGALHRVLNASRKPGLTEYLEGEIPGEQIVQATDYPGLWFIGSGARRRAGPELLSSAAMARFVTSLRGSYDVILIDSSPLAAGVDSYALATLTGNLVVVLRSGVTDRQMASAKLGIVDRLPVRVLGSIVNDVRPGGDYQYYSYYLAGYELDEEVTPASGAGRRILPHGRPVVAGAGSGRE